MIGALIKTLLSKVGLSPAFATFALIGAVVGLSVFGFKQCSRADYAEAANDTLRNINKSLIAQRDGAFHFADSINSKRYADRDSIKKMVDKLPVSKQSELVRSTLAKLYPN